MLLFIYETYSFENRGLDLELLEEPPLLLITVASLQLLSEFFKKCFSLFDFILIY